MKRTGAIVLDLYSTKIEKVMRKHAALKHSQLEIHKQLVFPHTRRHLVE